MRTLKKTLSLVLVVAMVLGLCVVGASAKDAVENFTDDYEKVGAAYQEAVGVLVGIGVIDGMTETALEPQATTPVSRPPRSLPTCCWARARPTA